jgi:hypothetical protein
MGFSAGHSISKFAGPERKNRRGAPLNAAAGKIIAQCQPRYRHQEFLCFLKHIDTATDLTLEIHLI